MEFPFLLKIPFSWLSLSHDFAAYTQRSKSLKFTVLLRGGFVAGDCRTFRHYIPGQHRDAHLHRRV